MNEQQDATATSESIGNRSREESPPPDNRAEVQKLQRSLDATLAKLKVVDARSSVGANDVSALRLTLLRGIAGVSALAMVFGLVLPMFIPYSSDARPKNLFQALDGSSTADVWDRDLEPGGGWLIPVLWTMLCAVLVVALCASTARWLVMTTQILCSCLIVGCLLGFMVLGGDDSGVLGNPPSLVVIILGGALGILAARLAALDGP